MKELQNVELSASGQVTGRSSPRSNIYGVWGGGKFLYHTGYKDIFDKNDD
jgi:hypothetical protein